MKKTIEILIIASILFNADLGIAQWIQQNSGTTNNLNSIFCASKDTVYASGKNGTILRTTNGGTTWDILNSGTNKMLNTIFFVNNETGYTAGEKIILKTIDHGENWFISYFDTVPPSPFFYSSYYLNKDTGFSVGQSNIFITLDGGNNWMQYNPPYNFYCSVFNSVFFSTNKIGYAVGVFNQYAYEESVIMKTIDGGNNWFMLSQLGKYVNKHFKSIFFIDSLKGWIGGGYFGNYICPNYRNLFKTIDGGITWDTLTTSFQQQINSISFPNDHIGYIADDTGHIYNTINNRISWQLQAFSPKKSIKSIHCIDSNICYAVGDSGLILKTINGGVNINEFENKNNFQVYPNPSKSKITIETYQKSTIQILNIQGQIIKTIPKAEKETTIDLRNLSSGVYIIKAITEKGIAVRKFEKE